jgi:hypothetical protein
MLTLGPLGMLPRVTKLESPFIDKIELIAALNLEREKKALLLKKPEYADDIGVIEREFKRYLSLSILYPDPDFPLAPAHAVDLLWHELILNTPKYHDICNSVFGFYLHHQPEDSASQKRALYAGQLAAYTKELMTQSFGGLDIHIWGTTMTCNAIGKCLG